jgi:hypothetical protein
MLTEVLAVRGQASGMSIAGWSRKALDRVQVEMRLAACSQLRDIGVGDEEAKPDKVVCDWTRSGIDRTGLLVLKLQARPASSTAYEALVERKVRVVLKPWVRRVEVMAP